MTHDSRGAKFAMESRTPGSGASRARSPHPRTALRRLEILKAATTLFATRGYRNASLAEIAEIVGITHAGVLHHFGSKEQLLVEVLEYRDAADVEELEDHRAPQGINFLRHLVRTVIHNTERPGIVQTYAVLSAESVTEDHPAHEWFQSRYRGLREMVESALREVVEGRDAPEAEVRAAVSAVIAVMDGLQVQWLLEPESTQMAQSLALTIDSFLERWGIPDRVSDALAG